MGLCQTFRVSWVGIGGGHFSLAALLMLSAKCAFGGPTQPQILTPNHFSEVSPLLQDVEIKKGEPFIEVFIEGWGHLDCFTVREFLVEKKAQSTQIIPRLRRVDTASKCKLGLKMFRDKAADLDPNNPASYEIEVLGYKGWEKRSLPR